MEEDCLKDAEWQGECHLNIPPPKPGEVWLRLKDAGSTRAGLAALLRARVIFLVLENVGEPWGPVSRPLPERDGPKTGFRGEDSEVRYLASKRLLG